MKMNNGYMALLFMGGLSQNVGHMKLAIDIFFIKEIEYNERWEVVFDEDGCADDEYYDDWQVDAVEVDWDTLEFNLNGKWIKYEVKNES